MNVSRIARIIGLEPRLRVGGVCVFERKGSIDGNNILAWQRGVVLLVGADVETFLVIQGHAQDEQRTAQIPGPLLQILISEENLADRSVGNLKPPNIARSS